MPVAIVGNGPVGATAALLLARWGIRTLVFERRDSPSREGSRAICQQRDVLDVWNEVGVARELLEEGITWSRARTTFRGRPLFTVELSASGSQDRFPPFVNVSQSRTEEALQAAVASSELIDVWLGCEVTRLEERDEGVELTVDCGGGRIRRVLASYVVVANGTGARPLREQLGIEFPGRSYDDRFLICDVRADLPSFADERRFDFDPPWNPGRQVLVHPQPGSVYRIDWQVGPEFDLEEERSTGALDRRIRQVIGQSTPFEVVWSSSYRFHGRCATRLRVGRTLLAGDAGHLMAPFGARGLNSGVHDAENLAWKLAFVLHGWSDERLLESYHQERWSAARENLRLTEATMRFLVPRGPRERDRRERILRAVAAAPDDASLRKRVDSGQLYQAARYSSSISPLFGGASVPSNASRWVGRLLADERDAEGRPLRSLARRGLLVLTGESFAQESCYPGGELTGVSCPVHLLRLQRGSTATTCLGLPPDRAMVVRPDAYVAGIARSGVELGDLARRAIAAR